MLLGCAIAGACLLLAAVGGWALGWWLPGHAPGASRYVGRQTCGQCHPEQLRRHAGSNHDRAMERVGADTVLGDFEQRDFEHFGVQTHFHRLAEQFLVDTEGPGGGQQTYPVRYTFGVRPLQQYLVEFPGGRLQCLPQAWDTEARRWFHLYPQERLAPSDELHWTGAAQNWNYMCAECHSTNLERNFELAANAYHTTWSEIDVSCEACHGPGSRHVDMAESWLPWWDGSPARGLNPIRASARQEIETCGMCHSRRRASFAGHQPGDPLLDHYDVELLREGIYYPDGQILEEDYEYGSFLESKMFLKGVRCTDCHDPHTATLRAEGNKLCNRCHEPARFDTPRHHHHAAGSTGASCVACHMPTRTYMVVDARHDHSLRIPRPDLSDKLQTPNTCTDCHRDQTNAWAAQHTATWYGPHAERAPHFGETLAAARAAQPNAGAALAAWARRRDQSPIVRATAVAHLAALPAGAVAGTTVADALATALDDPEAMVRLAAVRGCEQRLGAAGGGLLAARLDDASRLVRTEAARALSSFPDRQLTAADEAAFSRSLEEYLKGQEDFADQAAAHLNLGVIRSNQGRPDLAEAAYATALRLAPGYVPARVNWAMLCYDAGRLDEAERLLREALSLAPDFAPAHYSLGLLLAESPARLAEAEQSLLKAVTADPHQIRAWYNLALANEHLGRPAQAEAYLRTALEKNPGDPQLIEALAMFLARLKRWDEGLALVEQWVASTGAQDQRAAALLEYLRPRVKAGSSPGPSPPPGLP
ncbi:MAG: tetratricopeptide repeat protein [Pirellulales bacterium]|nr:tetratricopeptide repeat protein [Pirellulales bacterium]